MGRIIPYILENKKCSKPPTRFPSFLVRISGTGAPTVTAGRAVAPGRPKSHDTVAVFLVDEALKERLKDVGKCWIMIR
jgi:hypothetical protein